MSPAGEAQIRELAARLRPRVTPDAIYCSDLSRSRRTAELLANGSAIPIRVRPALREIDMGDWQGLSRREVAERRPADYAARGRDIANFRPPGGESFADLAARVLPCWRDIVEDGETQVVADRRPRRRQPSHPLPSARGAARQSVPDCPAPSLRQRHRVAEKRAGRHPHRWRLPVRRDDPPARGPTSSAAGETFAAALTPNPANINLFNTNDQSS